MSYLTKIVYIYDDSRARGRDSSREVIITVLLANATERIDLNYIHVYVCKLKKQI